VLVNSATQHVFVQPRKFRLKHLLALVALLLAGVLVAGVGYVKYQELRRIRIATAVSDKLNTSDTLRQAALRVFVSDTREVILDGKVPSKEDFMTAGQLAASVPGVTQVINRVAYPPVIQATGSTVVPAQASEALISDGTKYLDEGKYAEAIACFSKAAEVDPNNTGAKEWLERARQAHRTEEELLKNRR
jgi:tetratricopeptide (TPR) repeat protein